MKLLTIIGITAATLAYSNAATINVTGGFGVGVLVATTTSGVTTNTASTLQVGGYSGSIFTAFVAPSISLNSGSKIAGSFVGTSPTSLNGAPIFIKVSLPNTLDGWAILSTANNFPADVSSALASQSVTFSSSSPGSVAALGGTSITGASFGAPGSANKLNFTMAVPEPSTALLGAIGVLGLLRRRRN